MRRMTKVSPYPYWHFFDAYPPGYLRAVYRGNGIPLPWGNMAQVSDPCPQWAVFRMIDGETQGIRLADLGAARSRALAAVLLPLDAHARHGRQSSTCCRWASIWRRRWMPTARFRRDHRRDHRRMPAPSRRHRDSRRGAAQALRAAARVLNIAWIEEALVHPARIICPRSSRCPRPDRCESALPSKAREITDIRAEILGRAKLPRK